MALPDVEIEVEDGGLGVVPDSVANVGVQMGICSAGTPAALYSFSTKKSMQASLGKGPLVEAGAERFKYAGGGTHLFMPINPSQQGAASAVTATGTSPALTVTRAPESLITVEVTTAGTVAGGTLRVKRKLGSGAFSAPVAPTASWLVPGTNTFLTFTDGTGFDVGDVFTIATDGTIAQTTDAGAGTGNITAQTSSPLDSYSVLVKITKGGALAAGEFQYATDDGPDEEPAREGSLSGSITLPAGGKYAIPGTGLVLNFAAGTYVLDDYYRFTASPAGFTTTDVNAAFTALLADPREWGFVHIVGAGSGAAASATMATAVDSQMTAAAALFKFGFGVIECPQTESDSTIIAAFNAFASTRIMVCCGDAAIASSVSGLIQRRNGAWPVVGRLALIPSGEGLGRVRRGALSGIQYLYRDEGATPALHDARFTTLRTYQGRSGFYITRGNMMASQGSDFSTVQRRRVMDDACRIARSKILEYIEDDVRVDATTGTIDERDAQAFEAETNSVMRERLVKTGNASAVAVRLDRSVNLLSTDEQPVEVSITPKAYFGRLSVRLGFFNPALSTQAPA